MIYAAPIVALIPPVIRSIAQQIQPGKNLWDWLTSIIIPVLVPLSIAFWGLLQQRSQQEIADAHLREEVLDKYTDFLSQIIQENRLSKNMSPVGKPLEAIRIKTRSILQRLKSDGERKGTVIKILYDFEILEREDFDLSGADLRGISLASSNLARSNLRGVNLDYAYLAGCNLNNANLMNASLAKASLSGANLSQADLSFVNFCDASLGSRINLFGFNANLSGAILLKADLETALIFKEQLEGENPPLICKVKLPSSTKVDPNRDCEKLCQVIKDRYPKRFPTIEMAKAYIDSL